MKWTIQRKGTLLFWEDMCLDVVEYNTIAVRLHYEGMVAHRYTCVMIFSTLLRFVCGHATSVEIYKSVARRVLGDCEVNEGVHHHRDSAVGVWRVL